MDSLIRNISACVQRVLVILVKNAITVRVNGLTAFFMRDEDTKYFDPDCYISAYPDTDQFKGTRFDPTSFGDPVKENERIIIQLH